MPMFRCSKCGCAENTATSNFLLTRFLPGHVALCSACDPGIGRWHGRFPKQDATLLGLSEGPGGFLIGTPPVPEAPAETDPAPSPGGPA